MCSALLTTKFVFSQEISVKPLPPSVVKTIPQSGDMTVDATATKQIAVTFSKEMTDGSWSWSQMSSDSFPQNIGNIGVSPEWR